MTFREYIDKYHSPLSSFHEKRPKIYWHMVSKVINALKLRYGALWNPDDINAMYDETENTNSTTLPLLYIDFIL